MNEKDRLTILAIDPGSTSTKIAVYEDEREVFRKSIAHTIEELQNYPDKEQQFRFRLSCIRSALSEEGIGISSFDAVVGRGGHLPGIEAGGYRVNEAMKRRLILKPSIDHASNLGALLAEAVAKEAGVSAYIYDAISADELKPVARITGMPEVRRSPLSHVLNSKAAGRKAAAAAGVSYEERNYLIAHLGGGISITAHEKGHITDVIRDDDGPFSPERSGSVPLDYIVEMCFSGEYTKKELLKKVRGKGGMAAYLGTSDCEEIEARIRNGDEEARLIYEAQAYQIAKGIGELSVTFDEPPIHAIILTGGLAYSDLLTGMITARVGFIAPVLRMPGENELESLSYGALRILRGEEEAKEYIDPDEGKGEALFV